MNKLIIIRKKETFYFVDSLFGKPFITIFNINYFSEDLIDRFEKINRLHQNTEDKFE